MVRAAGTETAPSLNVPDVAGLSIREARRLLLSCGLDCAVRGFGIVERQDPPAGALLSRLGRVILTCRPRSGETVRASAAANGAGD
jgi:beta-lactam-binding protein with PASTA domain